MWRLWHRLFGWDYVALHWGVSRSVVCRVQTTPDGYPFVIHHEMFFWLNDDYTADEFDGSRRRFAPLTFELAGPAAPLERPTPPPITND